VVGSLYVGARRATLVELQHILQVNIVPAALVAIVPVALLALPIARMITRPLEEMAQASPRSRRATPRCTPPTGAWERWLCSDILLQDMPEGTHGSEDVQMIAREARSRSKRIVENYRGKVDVQSTVGKGSTFTMGVMSVPDRLCDAVAVMQKTFDLP
jgi:hypothetical protein